MKKKLVTKIVSIAMAALMMASLTTACGGSSETPATNSTPVTETKVDTPAPAADTKTETAPESQAAADDSSTSEGFTLLDVTTDMIKTGVYAISEDGTELVFSMFTVPSGEEMASLFIFDPDGTGAVICGTYEFDSETDENGIAWSLMKGTDVYSGNEFQIGFGESDEGEVYIFDKTGDYYEGQYLDPEETIVHMGTAAALMEGGAAGGDTADNSESEGFTLLDVTTDMIKTGVYAKSEDGTELVFSMFTVPSGEEMASLFIFDSDGTGAVICGTYGFDSETDENGIAWSLMKGTDVYSGNGFQIGFGESDEGEVYIFDNTGDYYEGQYLDAEETIVYMGTAAALME